MQKRRKPGKIQEDILDVLRAGGAYTCHEIANQLGVKPSTWLRGHLAALRRDGIIECEASLHWSGNIEKIHYRIHLGIGENW